MLLTINLVNTKGEEQKRTFEDVIGYLFAENGIEIHFNTDEKVSLPTRSNDGLGTDDWTIIEIKASRVGMKVGL